MLLEDLIYALTSFVMESEHNYVTPNMAIEPADVGQRLYDAPIVAVGAADDSGWEIMKHPEAVGELFRTPREWICLLYTSDAADE